MATRTQQQTLRSWARRLWAERGRDDRRAGSRRLAVRVPKHIRVQDRRCQPSLRPTAFVVIVYIFFTALLVLSQDARGEEAPVPPPRVPETMVGKDTLPLVPTPAGEPAGTEARDTRTPSGGSAPDYTGDGGLGAPLRERPDSNVKTVGASPPVSGNETVAPLRDETGKGSETDALATPRVGGRVDPAETAGGVGALGQTGIGGEGSLIRQLLEKTAPLEKTVAVSQTASASEPIKPIPEETVTNPEKVALGRALFHDPRLSRDNTTACVSCHDLGSGGDDGRKVSIGISGRLGPINAPTVFNVGLNFKQFWDGRADTLEKQIDGPVQSLFELGSLWPDVVSKLYDHETYPQRFKLLYREGITRATVKDALAEYMRSLTTPNSRFDQWLRGDNDAIDQLEKYGYALFKHYGCVSCHQGANVGGNMFQVFGVINSYFEKRGNVTPADLGLFNITGEEADRHAFKVPSLRMVAHTAPYLHDGSAATLRDAVDAMFEFQLGRTAPDEDKEAIVAFIRTLVGDNKELFQ